jgi:hypothetical protein
VRRQVLRGLPKVARRIASALLGKYDGWDASTLSLLRTYAFSCDRLEHLQATGGPDFYRELRANLAVRASLNLREEP